MVHKIVRENGTEIPNIKSCVYKRDINGETNLRVGCVSSANIEVTVFGKKKDAPAPGEKLQFYEMVSGGTWRLTGTFYAEPAITSIATYKFLAYDKAARLDVDFSARLWELQNAFPMSLYALVSYAATVAGVTLHSSVSSALSGITVKQFYADNITCRQIFSWAAELVGKYVVARTDNEQLTFIWYSEQANTRVYPTNTNLPIVIRNPIDVNAPAGTVYINVLASNVTEYQWQFKRTGATVWSNATGSGYNTNRFTINLRDAIDGYQYRCKLTNTYGTTYTDIITVHVDSGGTYVEPTYSPLHYDTETTIAYRQNGLQYENYTVAPVDCVAVFSVDDDNTSVMYPSSSGGDNIYSVYNNLLLTGAESTTLNTVAQNIYTALRSIPEYRPATIKLFPSENQILTGAIVAVTDAQGFSFTTIVMSIVSDSAVDKLKSTGAETYEETDQVNQKSKIVNMASSILRLKKLIVDEVDAIIARIDTLFANEITVTGSLHSDDYVHYSGQPFAARGMAIDLGKKSIDAPYYFIDGNGNMSVRSIYAGDLYFSDAFVGADSTINHALYQMIDSQGAVSTNYSSFTASATLVNSYEGMGNGNRNVINGYLVNEVGKIIYRLSTDKLRYAVINVLAPASIVSSLPKATVEIKYFYPNGQSEGLLSSELEYGTFETGSLGNALYSYVDFFYYANLPRVIISGGYVEVSVSMQAGTAVSLDSVNGYYSAWYGYNNDHTYGGTGTYVGTDGISADKMQVNGNDVWSKGDFTLPLPVDQGGTGGTTAVDALGNLNGVAILNIGAARNSSPRTLTFSGSVRFVLFLSGATSARSGAAMVYCPSSTGNAIITPIGTVGSGITLAAGSGTVTITPASGASTDVYCYALCLSRVTYERITVS